MLLCLETVIWVKYCCIVMAQIAPVEREMHTAELYYLHNEVL